MSARCASLPAIVKTPLDAGLQPLSVSVRRRARYILPVRSARDHGLGFPKTKKDFTIYALAL